MNFCKFCTTMDFLFPSFKKMDFIRTWDSIQITFARKCVDGHKVDQIVGISIEQSSLMSPFRYHQMELTFYWKLLLEKVRKVLLARKFSIFNSMRGSYFYISKSNCWQFKNQFGLMRSSLKVDFCTQPITAKSHFFPADFYFFFWMFALLHSLKRNCFKMV